MARRARRFHGVEVVTADTAHTLQLIEAGQLVPVFDDLSDDVIRAMWADERFSHHCDELYVEMHRRGYGDEAII